VHKQTLVFALVTTLLAGPVSARVLDANVERNDPDTITLAWNDVDPVAIYEADHAGFALKDGHLLTQSNSAGHFIVKRAGVARHYFALVDGHDHHRFDVAERLIPLAQGSNFRDIGGYTGADGKQVRWGLIYRSGAQPLLTPADVDMVKGLGVTQLVDLRSDEERLVAPTRINGVPYAAVGYGIADIMRATGSAQMRNGADIYRNFPELLAPQIRIIFAHLLHDHTPIAYNCSAGQDRTGFVTAVILTSLGVSHDTILTDYHLSTRYRHPEFEMPPIDPALVAANPGLQMFAAYRSRPDWKTPQPLMDKDGQPFLRGAFDAINEKWGSLDAYLQQEVGVGPAEIAQLRRDYLE
jgi:protein-tyrosine phosphatase